MSERLAFKASKQDLEMKEKMEKIVDDRRWEKRKGKKTKKRVEKMGEIDVKMEDDERKEGENDGAVGGKMSKIDR